jgi:5'-nucleotidase
VRILITNDDGIHAPGLKSLEKIARAISDEVWIVAPETEQSGSSHSLTLADPLRLRKVDEAHFAVKGTPSDCVLMAVKKVMPEPPDIILSGVNRGQNIADDVTYSGTIAAAMEGTALGIPSIALSQAFGLGESRAVKWETAERHGPSVVERVIGRDWGPGILLNVNFPDVAPDEVAGVEVTDQGKRDQGLMVVDERVDARGNSYYWLGFERRRSNPPRGSDLRAVYDGYISVTPLHMNLTHTDSKDALARMLRDDGNGG